MGTAGLGSGPEAIAAHLVAGGGGDGSGGRRQVLMVGEAAVMVGAAGLWWQGTAGDAAGCGLGVERFDFEWPAARRGKDLGKRRKGHGRR